jgi:uncharacterized protein (TIGR02466 family)
MSYIRDLFSIPLYQEDLSAPFTEEEISFIVSRPRNKAVGNNISKTFNILSAPEMVRIKNVLEGVLLDYTKQIIRPDTNTQLYITESWLNYNNAGEFHHVHYHQNSYASGVLYIQAPIGSKISFHSPHDLYPVSIDSSSKYMTTLHNASAVIGRVFIFPSQLRHEVTPNSEDGLRISLAFNTFVRGTISRMASVALKL